MQFRRFNKAAVRDAMLEAGYEVLAMRYSRIDTIRVDVVRPGQRPDIGRVTKTVTRSDMVRAGHRFEAEA
jgi:hypothetical protein